jgi:hypothetical protein
MLSVKMEINPMKKIIFLLLTVIFIGSRPCKATEHTSDELLSWITLTPQTATPEKVTNILGKPLKVEENKKRTWWYYGKGNTNLVISWNNKSGQLEKFSFSDITPEQKVFDTRISGRLRSGVTDMKQAIAILGVPKDMIIKEVTQEMHYAYKNSILRLFFRNRLLVDFTLLSQTL